jgi:hypothetical protein
MPQAPPPPKLIRGYVIKDDVNVIFLLGVSFLNITRSVGRGLSFFSSRRNWDSPTPHAQASSVRGGVHTRLQEREVGESCPSSDEGTYTVVLLIYVHFVTSPIPANVELQLVGSCQ